MDLDLCMRSFRVGALKASRLIWIGIAFWMEKWKEPAALWIKRPFLHGNLRMRENTTGTAVLGPVLTARLG